ncbi:MAG: shikimate dehydrogenase [Roseimicrobium sp.]
MTTKSVFTLDDLRVWESVVPTLDPPAKLAVIGDPIAHSRSPQMHNPALTARGIPAQYIRVHVPAGNVAEALGLFAKHGFLGVNCTIPHKFEALEAVDEVDDLAQKLGAVNTVAIREGKLIGYNSDGPGFLRSVEETFGACMRDLRVLIIGAGGGAGRAVAVQCALERCAKLVLVNRTLEKLESLTREVQDLAPGLDVTAFPWTNEAVCQALAEVDLIVNASPIGMKPGDADLFDLTHLRPTHLVYDMVYRADGDTSFIAAAKAAGAKTCNGLVLLLHQGAISFGHWFGEPVPLEAMRKGLV